MGRMKAGARSDGRAWRQLERSFVVDLLKVVGAVAVFAALIGGPMTALARVTGYAVEPGSWGSSIPSPQPWPLRTP